MRIILLLTVYNAHSLEIKYEYVLNKEYLIKQCFNF